MSGHSKWSKVKHQKAVTDSVKSNAFTKASKAISVAVKAGGGIIDPDKNFRLRLAIEKARQVNMPKDNIERAISKASGANDSNIIEDMYDAIGPGNTSLIILVHTDNSNRTLSQVKNILERNDGKLVAKGTSSNLFTQNGLIIISKKIYKFDDIYEKSLNFGATDILDSEFEIEIYTKPEDLKTIKDRFENEQIEVINVAIIYKPVLELEVNIEEQSKNLKLIDVLEEIDDVEEVFSNMKL